MTLNSVPESFKPPRVKVEVTGQWLVCLPFASPRETPLISVVLTGFKVRSAKSLQSFPTLCDPMNCSPPGSSAHEILQARILEPVAIPFSRGFSQPKGFNPGLLHCRQILYRLSHQGSPYLTFTKHTNLFIFGWCIISS